MRQERVNQHRKLLFKATWYAIVNRKRRTHGIQSVPRKRRSLQRLSRHSLPQKGRFSRACIISPGKDSGSAVSQYSMKQHKPESAFVHDCFWHRSCSTNSQKESGIGGIRSRGRPEIAGQGGHARGYHVSSGSSGGAFSLKPSRYFIRHGMAGEEHFIQFTEATKRHGRSRVDSPTRLERR